MTRHDATSTGVAPLSIAPCRPRSRLTPGALAGFFVAALVVMLCLGVAGCDAPPPLLPDTRIDVRLDRVRDGDSLAVVAGRRSIEVRLHGIDAPEYDQPWGRESRAALESLLDDAPLAIEILDEDRYGRSIAHVYVASAEQPVAAAMLRRGHAWLYRRYEQRSDWSALELEARVARRGLWAAAEPIPPWAWRQRRAERAQRENSHTLHVTLRDDGAVPRPESLGTEQAVLTRRH